MNTKFGTGRGATLRNIDIGSCFEALGPTHAEAILDGKSKSAWWKLFLEVDNNIIKALSSFGTSEMLPSLETLEL